MRVAVVAETFLPTVNGVSNSVVRVVEHLRRRGHDPLIVAPGPGPDHYGDVPVERVRAVPLPLYRSLPVGLPTAQVEHALQAFRPDVVHLAAPVVLGAAGALAARRLDLASVAVYQTDLAGFVRRWGLRPASRGVWAWLRYVHGLADLTLAPSTAASWELGRRSIGPVARWGRGVDLDRFNPARRSALLHRRLAGAAPVLVGTVSRLAPEKRLHLLAGVATLPGCRVAVVGEGPSRARLERRLPHVDFVGFRGGDALAATVASFDIFVHTGADETFCQAVQEALASGVPVVAPAAGGIFDLVRHGENGWLWPPNDAGVLREAVRTLAEDPATRARMGTHARASVAGRTWTALGDELLDHYDAVLGRSVARLAA